MCVSLRIHVGNINSRNQCWPESTTSIYVGKTIINHLFGNGLYHLFMVMTEG